MGYPERQLPVHFQTYAPRGRFGYVLNCCGGRSVEVVVTTDRVDDVTCKACCRRIAKAVA